MQKSEFSTGKWKKYKFSKLVVEKSEFLIENEVLLNTNSPN